MMTRPAGTIALLLLAGCGSTLDNLDAGAPGPVAGTGVHDARSRAFSAEREPLWIPDVIRNDPAARSLLMEQLRVQVMQKAFDVTEADRLVVREGLRRQLNRAGFDFEEISYILSSLDQPRAQDFRRRPEVADRPGGSV